MQEYDTITGKETLDELYKFHFPAARIINRKPETWISAEQVPHMRETREE